MKNSTVFQKDTGFWINLFSSIAEAVVEQYVEYIYYETKNSGEELGLGGGFIFNVKYKNINNPLIKFRSIHLEKFNLPLVMKEQLNVSNIESHSRIIGCSRSNKVAELESMIDWIGIIAEDNKDENIIRKLNFMNQYYQGFCDLQQTINSAISAQNSIKKHLSNTKFVDTYKYVSKIKQGENERVLFAGIYIEFENKYCCGKNTVSDSERKAFYNYGILFGGTPNSKNYVKDIERAMNSYIKFTNGQDIGMSLLKNVD